MSRTNLAHLEPSAPAVLSVADPASLPVKAESALGEPSGDLDHLCRLLIRTERSLSLVNRRSFAAALADVPPVPNQALRPAPPFPEAVNIAREEGKLLERTRLFLAQNPRALDELTPELTCALLRHFDPTARRGPAAFTRHLVAVGGVMLIGLVAVALGIIHTQQNEAVSSFLNPPAQSVPGPLPPRVSVRELPMPAAPQPLRARTQVNASARPRFENQVAVIPRTAPPAAAPIASAVPIAPLGAKAAPILPPIVVNQEPPSAVSRLAPAAAAAALRAASFVTPAPSARPALSAPPSSSVAASPAPRLEDATALVLRTIVAENPDASVEWIRAAKSSDHVITVLSRVRRGAAVDNEIYRLWSGHGNLTVIHHDAIPQR